MGDLYPSDEGQSVYSTAAVDWAIVAKEMLCFILFFTKKMGYKFAVDSVKDEYETFLFQISQAVLIQTIQFNISMQFSSI